jgi:two-component system CheB/CheR fusion protein
VTVKRDSSASARHSTEVPSKDESPISEIVSQRILFNSGEAASLLAAIVEFSHDAIISKDLNGIITSWNRGAEELFGYTADEIIGRPVTTLMPPDRQHEEPAILERLRRGEHIDHFETVRQRKDGTLVEISLTVSPLKNDDGRVIGASKIARDITVLQRARNPQALLLGEMQHRCRNLAAVIESLGRGSLPKSEPVTEAFFNTFVGRVRALLSTGEILISSETRQADLRAIALAALDPFLDTRNKPRVHIEGPPLSLSEYAAAGLALAFHELATNALKYGALKSTQGKIDLLWSARSDGAGNQRIKIIWNEEVAEPILPTPKRGFGSRLIRSAVANERDARTEVVFDTDGLQCVFEFTTSH